MGNEVIFNGVLTIPAKKNPNQLEKGEICFHLTERGLTRAEKNELMLSTKYAVQFVALDDIVASEKDIDSFIWFLAS